MTTTTPANSELRRRVEKLRSLPSSPAVLQPLLDLLRRPPDEIELSQVVQLVSYEKTIAAQLLRIANSPLYARARPAESIQSAIFTLGIQRIEDILLSNCFGKLVPQDKWVVDPAVFWRHSFGCALVCREFAERIDYYDPDKAYLAGLLHDLGIIVNSLAYNDEYRTVLAEAVQNGRPLDEQEKLTLGFTHCESGVILAKTWQLPDTVCEVIEWHHDMEHAPANNPGSPSSTWAISCAASAGLAMATTNGAPSTWPRIPPGTSWPGIAPNSQASTSPALPSTWTPMSSASRNWLTPSFRRRSR